MPKLSRKLETKTVELPNFPSSEVEVQVERNVAMQRNIAGLMKDQKDEFGGALVMLENSIIKWNMTDDDNNVLPITSENISQIGDADFQLLMSTITGKTIAELQEAGQSAADKKKA